MPRSAGRVKKLPTVLTVSSIIAIADFFTKKLIVTHLEPFETIDLLPFLRIVHITNTGAAFGILSNLGNRVFIAISFVAILLIAAYVVRARKPLEIFSLSLVLGGAAGNLIDRIKIGKVIDFIDFFVGEWHWPAFNVADSALTVGIILFLAANIFQKKDLAVQE